MATIATLDTVLRAKTSKFDRDIAKSQGVVNRFSTTLKGLAGISITNLALVRLGQSAFRAADHFATLADEIAKTSQRLKISTKDFQSLAFVLERNGASSGALSTALKTMSRQLYNAGRGSKDAQDAFAALGVNMQQLVRLSPDDQFRYLLSLLGKIENESRQAALAQALFGRSGMELIPALNNFEQLERLYAKYNLKISPEALANAEKFKDATLGLSLAWNRLGTELSMSGSGLIKIMGNLTDLITDAADKWAQLQQRIVEFRFGIDGGRLTNAAKEGFAEYERLQKLVAEQNRLDEFEKTRQAGADFERDRAGSLGRLDLLIERQTKVLDDFSKNSPVADLPQALQRNTAETLSFINRINRRDDAQAANAIRRQQLAAEEKQLEELKKLRERTEKWYDSQDPTKVEIL